MGLSTLLYKISNNVMQVSLHKTLATSYHILYYSVFPSKIQGMTGGHDLGMAVAKSKCLDFPNSTSKENLYWTLQAEKSFESVKQIS